MQFKEGTTVYTAEGEKLGNIERFVLDPRERKIIGLIVRKGFFFPEDKVIPVEHVLQATEDRVTLEPTATPQDFPPFEETHYVAPDEVEAREAEDVRNTTAVYYFPPLQTSAWYGSGYIAPQVEVKTRNVPDDAVALNEGAKVMSRDGKHVGDVKRIYTNPRTDEITHLAVTKGLFFKEEKVLPAMWVNSVMESHVQLAVGSHTLKKLPVLE